MDSNKIVSNVQIADDVILSIASLAATNVDGVDSVGEGITFKAMPFIRSSNLKQSVILEKDDNGDNLVINIKVVLKQGVNMKNVCSTIQEKIKESIESMLDLNVKKVSVRVAKVSD